LGGWKIPIMLQELRLKNFRGFEEHAVPLHPTTLVVGRNNAGKSSLDEALRLLSLVTTRFRALGYHEGPSWGGIPKRDYGVSPSLKGMEINFSTLFHRYGDPPAILEASFSNQTAVRIYIGSEERVHAVIFDAQGHPLRTKAAAIRLELPAVEILPQVGPLDTNETVLSAEYVRRAASSNLASKHFRNQLKVFSDRVAEFRGMVEETWPGLRILDLQAGRGYPGERLYLTVRDKDFAAEVAAMGHGLQMWLQTMWFLARVGHAACVILDEPDVYMHPDLQRRLVRYLRTRHQQSGDRDALDRNDGGSEARRHSRCGSQAKGVAVYQRSSVGSATDRERWKCSQHSARKALGRQKVCARRRKRYWAAFHCSSDAVSEQ
jgi:AAA ATPase domain